MTDRKVLERNAAMLEDAARRCLVSPEDRKQYTEFAQAIRNVLAELEDYDKQGRDLEDLMEQRDVVMRREAELKAENERLKADKMAIAEMNAQLRDLCGRLVKKLGEYLQEYDTPVPDLLLRAEYRKQLIKLLAEAREKGVK